MRKINPETKSISQLWKVGRLLAGKTQTELSKELGISQSSISKYESMVLEPSASDWYQFCQLAGFSAHKALELGYIDGCSKFKITLHRSSAFKLPLKYRRDFALKVREIIPFKECIIKTFGESEWELFLEEVKVVPELFFVYDYQLSLRFIFDLAEWFQLIKNVDIFEMVGKYSAQLENHGIFKKQYLKQKTASDLLIGLLENQPFYQRAFTAEAISTKKGLTVNFIVEPEIYDVFGELKMKQYLFHKINSFQEILNQNTEFKGDFKLFQNDFAFILENAG